MHDVVLCFNDQHASTIVCTCEQWNNKCIKIALLIVLPPPPCISFDLTHIASNLAHQAMLLENGWKYVIGSYQSAW